MTIGECQVIYDSERDTRNWFDATRTNGFCGRRWSDELFDSYLDSFRRISKPSDKQAAEETQRIVTFLYDNKTIKKKGQLEAKLKSNFQEACEWVEKNTGKEFSNETTTIFLTTFPRIPYSLKENSLYFCIHWDNITWNFPHEALHIRTYHY